MISDNLSHDVDVTEPFADWEEWDKQRILSKGRQLAEDLDWDVDDIFITCMVALTEANAHKLVANLEHTKEKFDMFLKERPENEKGF